jgi:hypothetical protein
MLPPPLWGPPPPLCGTTPDVGAIDMPGDMPGAGGVVGAGDGLGIGAALTIPNPNITGDMATPAAIAAALTARFRFIGFRFPRRWLTCWSPDYPDNAATNLPTPRSDVAIGLTTGCRVRSLAARREKTRPVRSAVCQGRTAAGIPASRRRLGGYPRRYARTSSIFLLEWARPDSVRVRTGLVAIGFPSRLPGAGPTGRR